MISSADPNNVLPDADVEAVAGEMRTIEIEPLTEAQPGDAGFTPAPAVLPPVMDKEAFWNFFASTFVFSGNAYAAFPPLNSPLQSLIRAPNHDGARPASDEIYDLAVKHAWLHWIIEDTTKDFRALIVIGAFATAIAGSVRNELRARAATVAQIEGGRPGPMHSDEAPPPPVPNNGRVQPAQGAPLAADVLD